MKIERALISVTHKEGLVDFARELRKYKIDIISTGGTAALLQENNVKVTPISDYTGFPEILGGRVKTLHPKIYGALLARQNDEQEIERLKEFGISQIQMVVVNLYPFDEVTARSNCTMADALENIDIGGVSLIRAAAKNYKDVIVVTTPKDYPLVLGEMEKNSGEVSEETRLRLAVQAYSMTAEYDRRISNYLYQHTLDHKDAQKLFTPVLHLRYRKVQDLRYGENPHQDGALYIDESVAEPSITRAALHSGKELSFNNIYDLHSGLELAKEFEEAVCVIVKHGNPCGVGRHKSDILKAYLRALESDPVSAFGGVVIVNREVSGPLSEEMNKIFLEVVLAPAYEKEALAILEKKKNLRILTLPFQPLSAMENSGIEQLDLKKITGGILAHQRDLETINTKQWKVVCGEKPSVNILKGLEFAWKVVKHVKSNAIVIADRSRVLGVGAGQMNRVESVRLALNRAKSRVAEGAVLASDAFFPFRDSIDLLEGSGIVAVIQPGGSVRDQEVIEAAKEKNITMIFTNERHFKH